MREADEAIVQLVKDGMSKWTTTMKKQLQVVSKGQPAPGLGQPGVPTAQVIVPPGLLPLGAPIKCGPATTDPNRTPIPQNALLAINQPQAQGQVIPGEVPAQAQVIPAGFPGQPQPEAHGQVVFIVPGPGQVGPGVIPGQPQLQVQGQVVPVVPAPGQFGPGVILGQPEPQAQGRVVPIVPEPGRSAKKYLASDPSALRADASDVASAFSTPFAP